VVPVRVALIGVQAVPPIRSLRRSPFEEADPEAASAAKRSLNNVIFEEFMSGKFSGKEDPVRDPGLNSKYFY
jgi:hypothetical protein